MRFQRAISLLCLLCGLSLSAQAGWFTNERDIKNTPEGFFMNSGIRVVDDPAGMHLVLYTDRVFSDSQDAIIDPAYHTSLERMVEFLKQYKTLRVAVTAHTDSIGDKKERIKLTEKHAMAIANYLLARDIAPSDIIAVKGEANNYPTSTNYTPVGRSVNRRVEVTILQGSSLE